MMQQYHIMIIGCKGIIFLKITVLLYEIFEIKHFFCKNMKLSGISKVYI